MNEQRPAEKTDKPRRGRPPTGKAKVKASFTVNEEVLAAAGKQAFKTGESLSAFISRAIQTQLMNS